MVPVLERPKVPTIIARDSQAEMLLTLLGPSFPTPSNIIVYGAKATGKTLVTASVLAVLQIPNTIVDVRLCINGRQLLQDIFASILEVICKDGDQASQLSINLSNLAVSSRNDSLNALQANLEKLFEIFPDQFVLVLDAVDAQRDAPPTLLPALARLGEFIPNLTIIHILTVPSPRLFHTPGIAHVHFPAYSRDEILNIVTKAEQLPEGKLHSSGNSTSASFISGDDAASLWIQFCAVMWDSIGKGAANDLVSFREACHQLWEPFIQPIIDGSIKSKEFAKLIVKARPLLQSEDALLDDFSLQNKDKTGGLSRAIPKAVQDLPYYTKYILIAAYLASYNPSRLDTLYFMKSTDKKRRRKQNAGVSKTRKIPRNLLAPAPFSLDRLLAITCALVPQTMSRTSGTMSDIATLVGLKLLSRSGGGGTDPLEPSSKFRVNVGWDFIVQCGRSVGLDVRDYAAWAAG